MDLARIDGGRDWFTEPRGWRDVARCLFGRHKVITAAIDRDAPSHLASISRCSCGAIRFGDRYWMEASPLTRRRGGSPPPRWFVRSQAADRGPVSHLDRVAAVIGREYGLTAEQVIQHIAIGDQPHPGAPDHHCGATDPRNDAKWCRRAPSHDGDHCGWPDPCPTFVHLRETR